LAFQQRQVTQMNIVFAILLIANLLASLTMLAGIWSMEKALLTLINLFDQLIKAGQEAADRDRQQ